METIIQQQAKLAQEIDNEFRGYESSSDRSEPTLRQVQTTINQIWAKFENNHKVLLEHKTDLKTDAYFVNNFFDTTEKRKAELMDRVARRLKEAIDNNSKKGSTTHNGNETGSSSTGNLAILRKKFLNRMEFMKKNLQFTMSTVENGSISLLQERIDDIKTEWKGLVAIYHEILDLGSSENDDQLYYSIKGEFELAVSTLKERIRVSNEVKLPTVNIPAFSGRDPKEWPNFFDLFSKTIHENVHLANIQKMQYLKTFTRDVAARAIRHLTTSDQNYETAWEILQAKFYNERKIVDNYIKTMRDVPRAQSNDAKTLRILHDTIKECVYGISNMGYDTDACAIFLNNIVIEKLDKDTKQRFEQRLVDPKKVPDFKDLLMFIDEQAETMEAIQVPQTHNKQNYKKTESNTSTEKCFVCKKEHGSILKCDEFMKMNNKERLEKVKSEKVCRMCFGKHHSDSCASKYICKTCSGRHSSLIHVESNKDKKTVAANTATNDMKEVFVATALIKCKTKHGDHIVLRAMIDTGSQGTFITEEAAQKLQLKRERIVAEIGAFGDAPAEKAKSIIKIEVSSMTNNAFNTCIDSLVVKKITKMLPNEPINTDSWIHLKNIALADPKYFIPAPIDISIGSDSLGEFILSGVIKGERNTPYAQLTTLGWVIMGKTNAKPKQIISCVTNVELEEQLKRFWQIESIDGENTQISDKEKCEQFFKENHTRGADGRYTVALPFNSNIKRLGKSRNMAAAQMIQLEKRFRADPALKEKYVDCINEYLRLGHMIKVKKTEDEMATRVGDKIQYNTAYLPHHAVFKESSSTTKTRVVYDASRKTTSGISLNDAMWIGPNIQQDIFSILLRWRKYEIVFSADIQKMYRQIWVRDEDAEFQRIVWRESENEPLEDYKLTTVTFGTGIAPYIATRTVQQRAIEERDNFPRAAEAILDDTYMDDTCSGTWSLEDAKLIQKQLKDILKAAGFDLKKWTSNKIELLYAIDEDDREIQPAEFYQRGAIKILGLQWDNNHDCFIYAYEIDRKAMQSTITKRQFLSATASLFDPIGWLTPVTVKIKIMYQQMWIDGTDWDENISQGLQNEWNNFMTQAPIINQIRVNRWIETLSNEQTIELHGFSDASLKAYGACIYVRWTDSNGKATVFLLAAKSRIAPRQKDGKPEITLPKLELCGALLLAELFKKVTEAIKMPNFQCYAWSDSMITIAWIRGQPYRWKTFVSNRTSEIRKIVDAEKWRYVPTDQNPADLTSRGLLPAELSNNELWWNGPKWLKQESDNWPVQPTQFNTIEEMRQARLVNAVVMGRDFFERFSNWQILLKSTAWCLRFSNYCRHIPQLENEPISLTESRVATVRIIQYTQQRYFADELRELGRGKFVAMSSRVASLCPFLDENGIMRVGGRLSNSTLPFNQRHPIIIPPEAHIARLIIEDAHHTTIHGGENATLAAVRSKYWIIKAKSLTKTYLKKCMRCARVNARTMNQFMADLPAPRVGISRPFTHCGIDYAGPFDIRTSKGRGHRSYKGYISLFICLATKAIHLEAVSDLKSTGFIAALKRFISRRGAPNHIYSDNGTNFCAGNKFIQAQSRLEIKKINDETTSFSIRHNIEWHFNPPAAPHFGGLWEAGVKSVKTHLKKLATHTFTFEEFTTILCQIEACLNSRPLCPLTNDPDDLRILTPAHFLTGDSLISPADFSVDEENINTLTRWQLVQQKHRTFWHQWRQEYLTRLQQRPKWLRTRENIQIGDLVLICDDNTLPTRWPMGRIVNIFPGQDGIVRVAEIKTMNGLVKRPIVKLSLLPNPEASFENEEKTPASDIEKPNERKGDKPSERKGDKPNDRKGDKPNDRKGDKPNDRKGDKPSERKGDKPNERAKSETSIDKSLTSSESGTEEGSNTEEPVPSNENNAPNQSINQSNKPTKGSKTKGRKRKPKQTPIDAHESTRETRSNRTRYNLRSLLTMLLITLFGLTIVGASDANHKPFSIEKFERQPGIYFEEIGHAKLVNNEWHLVVYYQLDTYFQQARLFRNHQKQIREICNEMSQRQFQGERESCQSVLDQLSHHLEEITEKNEILHVSNSAKHERRRRRGLINGVGMIANEAFGVLDYRFAERYERDIKKTEADQEYMLSLVKNQTSIFDATTNLMKRSTDQIKRQFDQLTKTCNEIEASINAADAVAAQQTRFKYFAEMSLAQVILLERYSHLQDTLIDLITDTHQGHANPMLVPPEQLRQQITFIQAHLPDDLSLPGGAHRENLIDLYSAMSIKTRTMREHIIFDIRLPLINNNEFQIFKLHPLPVLHRGKIVSIKPSTEYLLVTVRRELFSSMTEEQVKNCRETAQYLYCQHTGPLYRTEAKQHQCEMSLLVHKQTLSEACELQIETKGDKWIQLKYPNRWIFSTTTSHTIDIVCANIPHHVFLAGQGILELHDHCSIQLPEVQIQSVYQISTRINRSYLPTLNLTEQLLLKNHSINRITKKIDDFESDYAAEIELLQRQMTHIKQNADDKQIIMHFKPATKMLTMFLIMSVAVIIIYLVYKRCGVDKMTQTTNVTRPTNETGPPVPPPRHIDPIYGQ